MTERSLRSPFETLGIPPYLLLEMVNNGDEAAIIRIAQGALRTLTTIAHPDTGSRYSGHMPEINAAKDTILADPIGEAEWYLDGTSNSRLPQANAKPGIKNEIPLEVLSSFENIDPRRVVPWMEGTESIYGIGDVKRPSGVFMIRYERNGKPFIYSTPTKEGEPSITIRYCVQTNTWQMVSTGEVTVIGTKEIIKYNTYDLVPKNDPENIIIVGSMDAEEYLKSYAPFKPQTDSSYNNRAILFAQMSRNYSTSTLMWAPFRDVWFKDFYKHNSSPGDALVLAKFFNDGSEPKFAITSLPITTREL